MLRCQRAMLRLRLMSLMFAIAACFRLRHIAADDMLRAV